jgi:hypothetical protein
VEFKLRASLTPVDLIAKAPQHRWYAWARRQELGWPGAIGVIVDERVKQAPLPPRTVKAKRKGEGRNGLTVSHALDQPTTPGLYLRACEALDTEPRPEALQAFSARLWQHRAFLTFTPTELDSAGYELVSAAQIVRDLDSGRLVPIRNGTRANCGGCRFKPICLEPDNDFAVNSQYVRVPPKRDR